MLDATIERLEDRLDRLEEIRREDSERIQRLDEAREAGNVQFIELDAKLDSVVQSVHRMEERLSKAGKSSDDKERKNDKMEWIRWGAIGVALFTGTTGIGVASSNGDDAPAPIDTAEIIRALMQSNQPQTTGHSYIPPTTPEAAQ